MNEQDSKKILKEAVDDILDLMRQEKWREAHRACLEILRFDPENIKIIRLKNKIEKAVKKVNRNAIEQDLKTLEPLWKENKYEELLAHLKDLQPYAVDFPKITGLTLKAQRAYQNQMVVQQEAYVRQELKEIQDLAAASQYKEALKRLEKMKQMRLAEKQVVRLIRDLKARWIDYEIRRNAGLLASEKYEDMLLMYQGLLIIDGKSEKVKKQIEAVKKKYQVFKIQRQRESIYKMLEKIKTLYQLGRFEQAVEMAEEILEADPANREAKFYLVRAEKKSEKAMNREIFIQMKNSRKQMREEMKTNRDNITRI